MGKTAPGAKRLNVMLEYVASNETFIIKERCEINLHSKADEEGNPISPCENPTRILDVGCEVHLQCCSRTNGIKVQMPTELVWVCYDELQKMIVEVKQSAAH
jgi:hypothetical protein